MIFGCAKEKARAVRSHLADFAVLPNQGFAVVATGHAGDDSPLAERVVHGFASAVEQSEQRLDTYREGEAEAVIALVAHDLNAIFNAEAQQAEWSYGASFVASWFRGDGRRCARRKLCAAAVSATRDRPARAADPLVGQLLREGKVALEDVRDLPHSVLLNGLGLGERFVCHATRRRVEPGDRFLLTTTEVRHRHDVHDRMSASSPDAIAREIAEVQCSGPSEDFGAAVIVVLPNG